MMAPRVVSKFRKQSTAVGCAASTLFFQGAARAADDAPQFRFSWIRSDPARSCPDQAGMEERVRARLGRDPFAPEARVTLEGSVGRAGRTWQAELRVRDENGLVGHRELEAVADDCGPLADAVVLALALTIDPDAGAAGSRPSSAAYPAQGAEAPSPPAAAAGAPAAFAVPSTPAAPSKEIKETKVTKVIVAETEARALIAFGVLPKAAPGAAVAGSFGRDWLRFTLGMFFLPETRTSDGRFAFGLTAGTAGACFGRHLSPDLGVSFCTELGLGAMHAVLRDASQLEPLDQGDHLWVAVGLGPRVAFAVPPLVLAAGVQAMIPILQNKFAITGHDTPIFEGAAVAGLGYFGVGFGGL